MGRGADCCCHRFRSKTDGIAKNFWSKRAAKRVCRRTPGELGQKLKGFARKFLVTPILRPPLNLLNDNSLFIFLNHPATTPLKSRTATLVLLFSRAGDVRWGESA